jgi:hypothetical protein
VHDADRVVVVLGRLRGEHRAALAQFDGVHAERHRYRGRGQGPVHDGLEILHATKTLGAGESRRRVLPGDRARASRLLHATDPIEFSFIMQRRGG